MFCTDKIESLAEIKMNRNIGMSHSWIGNGMGDWVAAVGRLIFNANCGPEDRTGLLGDFRECEEHGNWPCSSFRSPIPERVDKRAYETIGNFVLFDLMTV